MTAYVVDGSWQRFGEVIVAGSPLRVFRLTTAGAAVAAAIEAGEVVADSTLVDRLRDAGAIHPRPDRAGGHRFGPDDVTIVTPVHRGSSSPRHGARPDSTRRDEDAVRRRIVVDDGSEPPIPDAATRLDRNQGPAAARNAGAAMVSTPLIAFVDDDVDLPDGWLDPLLPHFDHDRVGLVAPRVRSRPGPGRIARVERAHSPLDLGDAPARIRAGTRVSYVPAAAVVVRADAFESVGGFEESLRFGEDVDLVWRLDEAGWGCRYEPASIVQHAPRTTWAGWARQRIGYGSSTAPLARRHPGALSPVRINRWSLAAWAAVPIWPTAGLVLGVGAAAALPRRLPMLPRRVAFGLAARGTARAGGQLADAVRRVWWPILAVAALRSRSARRVLVASWLAAGSPARVAGDLCSSIGIWRGVLRERSPDALVPRFDPWPPPPIARPVSPAATAAAATTTPPAAATARGPDGTVRS